MWTDYISAPAEELPGTLQNVILKKDPPTCLQKSPLGGHSGAKAHDRVTKGGQKGAKKVPTNQRWPLFFCSGRPWGSKWPQDVHQEPPHTPMFDDFGPPLDGCLHDFGPIFRPCLTLCLRWCFAVRLYSSSAAVLGEALTPHSQKCSPGSQNGVPRFPKIGYVGIKHIVKHICISTI